MLNDVMSNDDAMPDPAEVQEVEGMPDLAEVQEVDGMPYLAEVQEEEGKETDRTRVSPAQPTNLYFDFVSSPAANLEYVPFSRGTLLPPHIPSPPPANTDQNTHILHLQHNNPQRQLPPLPTTLRIQEFTASSGHPHAHLESTASRGHPHADLLSHLLNHPNPPSDESIIQYITQYNTNGGNNNHVNNNTNRQQ